MQGCQHAWTRLGWGLNACALCDELIGQPVEPPAETMPPLARTLGEMKELALLTPEDEDRPTYEEYLRIVRAEMEQNRRHFTGED